MLDRAVYSTRASVETRYREWKHGRDIPNLRSHTPMGILQEIHAPLLLSNLVRWVMTDATEGSSDTPVDLSLTTALTHPSAPGPCSSWPAPTLLNAQASSNNSSTMSAPAPSENDRGARIRGPTRVKAKTEVMANANCLPEYQES